MSNESRLRNRNSNGFTVVEVLLGISLLMIPAGLLAFEFPHYASMQQYASATAREVSRTIATTGQTATAQTVAEDVADNYGLNKTAVVVEPPNTAAPAPANGQVIVSITLSDNGVPVGAVTRGGSVSVDVEMRTSVVSVNWLHDTLAATITAHHVEVVDRYGSFQCDPGPC